MTALLFCKRPGCTAEREEGQGRQLCAAHRATSNRIISQRVPPHVFSARTLTVRCKTCGAEQSLAGMTRNAAEYQAKVWACEHAVRGWGVSELSTPFIIAFLRGAVREGAYAGSELLTDAADRLQQLEDKREMWEADNQRIRDESAAEDAQRCRHMLELAGLALASDIFTITRPDGSQTQFRALPEERLQAWFGGTS